MKRFVFILIITSLLLAACANAAATPEVERLSTRAIDAAPANEASGAFVKNAYDITTESAANPQRLVIQNVDMTLVVKDPQTKMDAISALAERLGGFVVSSNISEVYTRNDTKAPEGSIVVRIPAEKLEEALKEIKGDVVEVQSENRSGEDVTQQYTDLGSQLKNLESTEQQLTLIMAKAEKTEDVLAVFNQLTQIRGQIEVIKGQMQYFEQSAALSAVSVRLVAEETIQPIEIAGWRPEGVVRDAIQTLVNFLQGFFEFVVNLVIVFLPAALLIFAVIYAIWQMLKIMWRILGGQNPFKRKTPPAPPAAPQPPATPTPPTAGQ